MKALPIAYIVKAANVYDKVLIGPLMKKASSLLRRYGKRTPHVIADSHSYSAEVFKTVEGYGAENAASNKRYGAINQPLRDEAFQS